MEELRQVYNKGILKGFLYVESDGFITTMTTDSLHIKPIIKFHDSIFIAKDYMRKNGYTKESK